MLPEFTDPKQACSKQSLRLNLQHLIYLYACSGSVFLTEVQQWQVTHCSPFRFAFTVASSLRLPSERHFPKRQLLQVVLVHCTRTPLQSLEKNSSIKEQTCKMLQFPFINDIVEKKTLKHSVPNVFQVPRTSQTDCTSRPAELIQILPCDPKSQQLVWVDTRNHSDRTETKACRKHSEDKHSAC